MNDINTQLVVNYVEKIGIVKGMPTYSRCLEQKVIRFYLFTYLRDQGLTFESIGRIFNLDHATIMHGIRAWKEYKNYDDVKQYTEYVRFLFPIGQVGTGESKHMRLVESLSLLESQLVTK